MSDLAAKLKSRLGSALAKCVTSIEVDGKVLNLGGAGGFCAFCNDAHHASLSTVPRALGSEFNMLVSEFVEEHKLERASLAGVRFEKPKSSRDVQGDQYNDQLGGNDDELQEFYDDKVNRVCLLDN
jgi:hypothetical protein